MNKNEGWIEIKLILLKHFLPDNYHRIHAIEMSLQEIKLKVKSYQRLFEDLYLRVKPEQIQVRGAESQSLKQLDELKWTFTELRQLDEEYNHYNTAFHSLINEHPLLASYSNIFVIVRIGFFNDSL